MGYANINDVQISRSGEQTSHSMAQTDSKPMSQYKSKIGKVAREFGIDPALIAAIISRESSGGVTLKDGWGDWDPHRNAFNGWGLMQVDVNPNGGRNTRKGAWDSEDHLRQATGILVYFIDRIRNKFPDWSSEQHLRGGIAAYNAGDGAVHSYDGVDANTAHGNYSNDVVARAKWYKKNGF